MTYISVTQTVGFNMEGPAIELLDTLPLALQILRFVPVSSSEDSAGVIAVNLQKKTLFSGESA